MRDHPAVENAAVAATIGWDPLRYLEADGADRIVADAVLERAAELRTQEIEGQARLIAVELSKILTG